MGVELGGMGVLAGRVGVSETGAGGTGEGMEILHPKISMTSKPIRETRVTKWNLHLLFDKVKIDSWSDPA